MNVTISIQDCTLQELQHLFARLADLQPAVAAAPAPALPAFAQAPADQPRPSRPMPGGRKNCPVVATHADGTERRFDTIIEAANALGMPYKTVTSALRQGNQVYKTWSIRYADQPASAPQPKPAKAQTERARMLAERLAAQEREEQALADTIITNDNGIREPLGKAIERLQAEKKRPGAHGIPVLGRHDDGDIRYFTSASEAARAIGVTDTAVRKSIDECRKLRGWMLEYDTDKKGGQA